ncbi:MAG TPA: carboxypeptidase regulatory-like domain-containing protein [Terriglobales bacterium]|nr:carboxypeptidase regulatory-like domain-containing protein [Terriglobales bacterium]
MKWSTSWIALAVAMSLCLVPLSAGAQQVMAAITGTVVDSSNAPLAGARVVAHDTDRGTDWTTTTNNLGVFNLPRLPVGNYSVSASAKGFQTVQEGPLTLVLNQTARLTLTLPVGQVTQTVEVTGAAPLLQTDSTQVSTIINARTNEALPLATRNYVELTLLSPGSVQPNPSSMTNGQPTGNGGRPYINGNREQANNFLLDGMDNNQVSDNEVGFAPSPDAIQEFNLITNNASAEFGNFQGGIISASIKSGTNHWHGDLFEFLRNDKLNANNWANNFSSLPRPAMRWNQFGGTVGGPILHNKLFIFGDYEGERFDNPATANPISVFTAAERQGDFSELLGLPTPIQLYNPRNIVNGQRQPFAGNLIAPGMIDPVAKALFNDTKLYPMPVNNSLTNNQVNLSSTQTNVDQFDVKTDYNLGPNDRMFGRVSHSREDNPGFNSFPLFFNTFFHAPVYNDVIDWTHSSGADFVNEIRFGTNYTHINNGGLDNGLGDVAQNLGIQNGNARGPGLMALNFSGGFVSGIGSSNIGTQQDFADTVIQFEDQIIITHGRHLLHTGFQYWRDRIDTFYAGNNGRTGSINYTGKFTAGPNPLAVAGSGTGAAEADFFLGMPDSIGLGIATGSWGQRANIFGAYLQDDWRATDTLTLNLGLRYENHTPWVEVKNREDNYGLLNGEIYYPQTSAAAGAFSNSRALYNSHNLGLDFQPRLGFAWSPAEFHNATVIRGAYTISSYLEGTGTNLRPTLNPPFATEFNANYDALTLPLSTTDQGFTTLSAPANPWVGALLRVWDPNIQPAIDQQWNLTFQHQFSSSTTFQAGYVGQHGTHLMVPMPYLQKQLQANGTVTPSPFLAGNPTLVGEINQVSGTASVGNQRYDALQSVLQRRFANGLQYQVAYTYSKCMTDNIGYYGSWGGQTTPDSPYWQNLYNQKAEWGPCYFDVTHVLSNYAVYDPPIGHGKAADLGRVGNAVFANWQLSGMWQWHGGYALTVQGGDASGTNSRGARADCLAPPKIMNQPLPGGSAGNGIQWFDPTPFGSPTPGTFGTCGVGTVRGPGLNTLDFSLQREFPLSESRRVEFRAEFINFTNTPILNTPDVFLGGGLGQITSSQGERNVQFALKFYY